MSKVVYNEVAQEEFLTEISAHYGNVDFLTKDQINKFVEERGLPTPDFLLDSTPTASGKYRVAGNGNDPQEEVHVAIAEASEIPAEVPATQVSEIEAAAMAAPLAPVIPIRAGRPSKIAAGVTESLVKAVDPTYVPFGFYNDLKMIISSKIFYPVFFTGLSGNGKTMMIEQVCADLKRECVRVNITKETDETDLIGSYELVDGNTVRREGPVIVAMKRGAVLLLDETDLGSERLLCLQPILEGKPYFDKKTGELIYPAPGFNVMATGNTKGKGSDDGRFIGTNVLNEAYLERFAITVEQEYPPTEVEKKILLNNFTQNKIRDDRFADHLVTWADVVRKTYFDGGIDEIISTRRLVHIVKAFSIFGNRLKAIELCLNRFDSETKAQFLDMYTKIDPTAVPAQANTTNYVAPEAADEDDLKVTPPITPSPATAATNATRIATVQTPNPAQPLPRPFTPATPKQPKSKPTAQPVPPVKVAWATPAIIAKVSGDFGIRIKIVSDASNASHQISSHGQTTIAKDSKIAAFSPDGVLSMIVDINLKKSQGVDVPNPFV